MKLIMIACAMFATSGDAGAPPSPEQQKECKSACDIHYTKVFKECNGVLQCEVYVRSEDRICYNECEKSEE